MQEKHLFEYSIIRVVPRVEREEFINVGVILYCSGRRFLQTVYKIDIERIQALHKEVDLVELEARLDAFKQVCKGGKSGGTIGSLPIASRFRWLTATRSTIVQSSAVHPGFCTTPEESLQQLFKQLVM